MNFVWYYIFNYDEFLALDLVSRTYDLILNKIGPKSILVTKGNLVGMTYEGVFLPLNLNDINPFAFEDFAIYIDENNNVWLGIAVE